MKILLLTDSLPAVPRGGLDLHVQELRGELERRGHQPVVAELGGVEAPSRLPGGRLRASMGTNAVEERLEAILRAERPDAVHIHNLQGVTARAPELARASGAAVVWTHHDLFGVCPRVHLSDGDGADCDGPDGGRRCGPCHGGVQGLLATPAFVMRNRSFAEALRLTHQHVAPSAWVATVLRSEGVAPDRITVSAPAPPRAGGPAGLPPEGERPRLVVAGDLREAKGADRVVDAFAAVADRACLEVWGGPPAAPAPREGAFERGLMERAGPGVSFHGRFQPHDLDSVLDGAAALVHCGRVRETFGRTVNEALQRGVPVVAVASGGLAVQVVDGVNGFLVPPGDQEALEAALRAVLDRGILLQADAAKWPRADTLRDHVDALEPLYEWRP